MHWWNVIVWQAHQNWASKCAAMNAMASQAQPHCNQYQQHQQVYTIDGQQGVNTFYHPGKSADNKIMQRNRQTVFNGGSGVRVVFLGASSGRESGTGVFLPRSFEPKKKNGEYQLPNMWCSDMWTFSHWWIFYQHKVCEEHTQLTCYILISVMSFWRPRLFSLLCSIYNFLLLDYLTEFYRLQILLHRTLLCMDVALGQGMQETRERGYGPLCSRAWTDQLSANQQWFTSLAFPQSGHTRDKHYCGLQPLIRLLQWQSESGQLLHSSISRWDPGGCLLNPCKSSSFAGITDFVKDLSSLIVKVPSTVKY